MRCASQSLIYGQCVGGGWSRIALGCTNPLHAAITSVSPAPGSTAMALALTCIAAMGTSLGGLLVVLFRKLNFT